MDDQEAAAAEAILSEMDDQEIAALHVDRARSVSRISSEDACAIATSCAPSTALTAPCSSPATSNSSPDSIRDACSASSTPIAARLGAQGGDPGAERAGRHTSSYPNTRTTPRVVHSESRCGAASSTDMRRAVRLFRVMAPKTPNVVVAAAIDVQGGPAEGDSVAEPTTRHPERLAEPDPSDEVTWPGSRPPVISSAQSGSAAHRGEAVGGFAGVGTARPPTPRTRATPTVSPCPCR